MPGVPPIIYEYAYDLQWEADEYREDRKVAVSEYLQGPGTIAHSQTFTVTWSVDANLSLDFARINTVFGGSYQQSIAQTNTYTADVPDGKTGRIVYVPYMHHKNGWVTITQVVVGVKSVKHPDHQWCPLYFPLDGGVYRLECLDGFVKYLGSGS